ncbi:hypothetical protein DPMN_039757 [Dreissena polymorpha]|uniref:NadR/Ttd14 AAA domain-containing protein n=2 Tax=Dreissena polymorpha TaxID=45954 RepID=A0A9D4HW72_DREPO|nr:hypothetical protein DPMN_039757 [Dreissena polymorpha]
MATDITRVYICGPHSTGKTTLLNDLRPHVPELHVLHEVARGIIKSHGWCRDDYVPDKHPEVFKQLNVEILEAQIKLEREYSEQGKHFICDRAIDPIVYGQYYVGPEARDVMLGLPGLSGWLESLRRSLVILVAPHHEIIKDDSVRLTSSIEELRDFYNVFAAELNYQKIPYVALYDLDRKVRVERVLNELKKFQTSRTGF